MNRKRGQCALFCSESDWPLLCYLLFVREVRMSIQDQNGESPRTADYPNIPDHSDLRGFSYRAPSRFDYRDEKPESKKRSFWQNVLSRLGLGETRRGR